MNWISFAEQRPKEEPKRGIWVKMGDRKVIALSDRIPNVATEWAEIQEGELLEPPPKPDPFDEAWDNNKGKHFVRSDDGKSMFKAGWDAAMKYKEGL